ncbi:hypothetical protein GQ53DRAFT_818432 [Thozetella sp. PMI_491]|nr:hypothetical protein GQ53DRAFT_818432 [Thozetella sp. PMI_491]
MESESDNVLATPAHARIGLAYLPPEIIGCVLRWLRPRGTSATSAKFKTEDPEWGTAVRQSRTALAAVCRTCRWALAIAKPMLYEEVALLDVTELVLFFRTLAADPGVRSNPVSFAWLGALASSDSEVTDCLEQPLLDHGTRMQQILEDTCLTTRWPQREDERVATSLCLRGPETFYPSNILAAVLALMPNLRALRIVHGKAFPDSNDWFSDWFSWEKKALEMLSHEFIRVRPPHEPEPRKALPDSRAFAIAPYLPKLSTLTIEAAEDDPATAYGFFLEIALLLPLSQSVRRLEIKGRIRFQESFEEEVAWGPSSGYISPSLVGENIEELVIMHGASLFWNMREMTTLFPKLRRLVAECSDIAFINHRPSAEGKLRSNFQLQLAQLKATLETFAVVSPLSAVLKIPFLAPRSALLGPGIREMSILKHMTTNCVWLFGRRDATGSLPIMSRLPDSLISFHLVDFWGVPIPKYMGEPEWQPRHRKNCYYPRFPGEAADGQRALEFFYRALTLLHEEIEPRLHNLRQITFSSPCFNPDAGGFTVSLGRDASETEAFIATFRERFRLLGVTFKVTTLPEWEESFRSQWVKLP